MVRFYITSDQHLIALDSFKINVFDKNYELSRVKSANFTEYDEVSKDKEYTYYTGEAYENGEMTYGQGRVYLSKHDMNKTLYNFRKGVTLEEEIDYLSEFKLKADKKYTVVMVGSDMYLTVDNP